MHACMPISGGLWNVGPAVRTRAPRPANSSTCTYAQLASCQAGQVYMYIVHAQGRAAAAVVAFVPSGAGVHVHVVVAFGRPAFRRVCSCVVRDVMCAGHTRPLFGVVGRPPLTFTPRLL
jgi:hypothetical protein